MKKISKLLSCLCLLCGLFSCVNNKEPSLSNSNHSEESSLSEDSFISNEKTSYEKDSEGFYIFDDDTFTNDSKEDDKEESIIRFASSIDESYLYKNMRLYIGDKQIPLYKVKTNLSQTWTPSALSRMDNAVGIIELKGKATFKLQTNFLLFKDTKFRPLSANIKNDIDVDKRVITFTISSPGQYTIEFRSHRVLHLFVHEYKAYESYKNEKNVIYFNKGIHNHQTDPSLIGSDHYIRVNSNTTIYLELGAILECGFIAYNASNINLIGPGIVSGASFSRDASLNTKLIPYDFSYCNELKFKGITSLDPAGWCYNLYFSNNIELDHIQIISSRSNGDGVSLQSCQNVTCKNSFVRSWEDSLVVKNYPRWNVAGSEGTTKNILFESCILWTDLAQSMEIGFETYGKIMEDIRFINIIVLHNYHKAPISIHNGNNADIKNVRYENITIEDASMGKGDGKNVLIDFSTEYSATWSEGHGVTALGSIDGVYLKNILVLEGTSSPLVGVIGCIDQRPNYKDSLHPIKNVTFEDISIYDSLLDENYENYKTAYSENIEFLASLNNITGANLPFKDVSSYGEKYQIEII